MSPTRPAAFCRRVLLALGSSFVGALGGGGCGTNSATPMPEPPELDGRKILPDRDGIGVLSEPRPLPLRGAPGAASPGSLVRVQNLDATGPAITTQAAGDGSFALTVLVTSGDELRLSAVRDGARSAPVDVVFRRVDDADTLEPSPRHACVRLEPGFELPFDAPGERTFQIHNDCSEALELAAPRFRLDVGFELTSALPLGIEAGGEGSLALRLPSLPTASLEDVLFVDVALGDVVLRYPLGAYTVEPASDE